MPESKIYTIIDNVAKSLGTVIYIILRTIFEAKASSIMRNSSVLTATTFVCTIPIMKFDDEEF